MNLRKTVKISHVIRALIILCAALLILAIYPGRFFRRTVTIAPEGQTPVFRSNVITGSDIVRQAFFSSYDKIDSIDLYVSELSAGRYLLVNILDEREVYRVERIVDLGEEDLPGYVHIPLGMEAHVGERYRLSVKSLRAAFTIGYEPEGTVPAGIYDGLSANWEYLAGRQLKMRIHYDLPLSKSVSLLLIAVVLAAAFALVTGSDRFFKAHPEKDRLFVRGRVVRVVAEAVCVIFYGFLFLCNFPLLKFDTRPEVILFYGAGTLLSAFLMIFAIRKATEDKPLSPDDGTAKITIRHFAIAVLLACAIGFTCSYVNGVTDAMHWSEQRKQIACLAGVILLTLPFGRSLEDWKTLPKRVSLCGILAFLCGLSMVIFRNTRWWIVTLFVVFLLLYTGFAPMVRDGTFDRVFTGAVFLHFLGAMGYCLIFRAFQAYQLIRYGMLFHTVTVTGAYLAMVTVTGLAAFVTLVRRGRPAWRMLLLFATAASYLIFTMSRIAFLATFLSAIPLILIGLRKMKGEESRAETVSVSQPESRMQTTSKSYLQKLLWSIIAVIIALVLVFPAAFTMQRMLPAIAGRHVMLEGPEEQSTDPRLLGSPSWNSPYYVNPERFIKIFYARVLGGPELPYFYPDDTANYDEQGRQLYDDYGNLIVEVAPPVTEAEPVEAVEPAPAETAPAGAETPAPVGDDVANSAPTPEEMSYEMSNGRTQIWKDYIAELNLTGHDTMETQLTDNVHAHNSYLQNAFDFGIISGILFLVWIGVTIMEGMRTHTVAFGVALVFALESVGEWTFHLSHPTAMIFLLAVAPLMVKREKNGRKQTSPDESTE